MKVTLELPDDVASDLPRGDADLADIISLGLREWRMRGSGEFGGLPSLLEALATQPPPEDILALRPTAGTQARVSELLEKNRAGSLSPEESAELGRHEFVEHIVRMAKGRAAELLAARKAA